MNLGKQTVFSISSDSAIDAVVAILLGRTRRFRRPHFLYLAWTFVLRQLRQRGLPNTLKFSPTPTTDKL